MDRAHCGVLLAGGRSARFGGSPKGLLAFGGGRLADGPLRALTACCDEVVIAANDADAESWFPGMRVVRDVNPSLGALGALLTALQAGGGRSVVVSAWDMPFVTTAVLRAVVDEVSHGARCCVPQHADGSLEPLCAAYAPSCLDVAAQLLADGERAAHALCSHVHGVQWAIGQQPDTLVREHTFLNINTPDDLHRAESWFHLHSSDA